MTFLVLTHVNPGDQVLVVKKKLGKCFGQFGLPHSGGSQEKKGSYGFTRILQTGTAAPYRIGHGSYGLVLPDDPLVKLFFQFQELFPFRSEHALHGYAGPFGYHLGNVFFVDGFIDHGAGEGFFPFVQQFNRFFNFHDLPVTDLGHFSVISPPFGFGGCIAQIFNFFFLLLDTFQNRFLLLPFGTLNITLSGQLFNFFSQNGQLFLILFSFYGLPLDFQLTDTTFQLINTFGNRIHFQPEFCCSFIHQVNGFVRQKTGSNVTV